jgi:hypothetical protein
VLFVLPALVVQGLLKIPEVYRREEHAFYSLESIVLTLAFMALLRIKNPEQLKQCKPGHLGRIIGLDRIPEVTCLRSKLEYLTQQQQATTLNNRLVDYWYSGDACPDADFLYIDGHVRIYYGTTANLPKKYVSRQRLCMSGTTEYWVNDAQGMPVLMVMGEVTEKLQYAIEHHIIPQLQQAGLLPAPVPGSTTPVLTFVFDREAYCPKFFRMLWELYRIAVITYRKHVQDLWSIEDFIRTNVSVLQESVIMHICEQNTTLDGCSFREIRRRSEDGHQTSIITTHPTLDTASVAGRMFGRWCQENFFRYLMQEYDFDKMVSFGTESVDPDATIVNPEYSKVQSAIRKVRAKIQRIEVRMYRLMEDLLANQLDAVPGITKKQIACKEELDGYKKKEKELLTQRSQTKSRLKISDMPEEIRYNKLYTESKLLMNVIYMICYRAESSLAEWIAPYVARSKDEKRMVVKQIIKSTADLTPDYEKKTLTVTLHSLSAPRFNVAAGELLEVLNQTGTIFPGTDLTMNFKISAISVCERSPVSC